MKFKISLAILFAVLASARLLAQDAAPRGESSLRFAEGSPRLALEMWIQPATEMVPAPQAQPALTLADLEATALANHPAIAISRQQVEAARGRWLQAGLKPNPTVGYASEEVGNEGSAGLQGGYVGQTFQLGGKRAAAQAEAAAEIARAEQQWASAQQRVLTDVRMQFDRLLIAQQRIELAEQLMQASQAAHDTTDELLRALEARRIDLLQAGIELQQSQVRRQQAQFDYDAQWRRMQALLGVEHLAPRQLIGPLGADLPAVGWEEALARLLGASPELAEAHAAAQQARRAVMLAEAQGVPDLSSQVTVQHDDGTHDTVAAVQIGLPLPLWNYNQGNRRAAVAELRAAEENIRRLELQLTQRLAEVFQQYQSARFQLSQYDEQTLPKSRETLDLVVEGYQAGQLDFLDLLTTQRTYFQTALTRLDALEQLSLSARQIHGLLLTGSLEDRR